ncbi:uncharacterized protein N0V89_009416 [Didymosphaeria variabile]|uniref:Uncharacterized protein n=1 Tax=Didymosphaeria variabile TaxID=1932322 RepID=A0A9W9C853_9PLEO|nr:uncharacterized protein N0V89_009416 [Didymosphaeria variabile]KAJ4348044.1 hypothetical protein N0V89_009416 [Didymosphaeria variabile]
MSSNEAHIARYRAAITRFENRRATATPANVEVYNICITTLNAQITHLETLDPKADVVKETGKEDDVEVCLLLDELQQSGDVLRQAPGPNGGFLAMFNNLNNVYGDLWEKCREQILEIGKRQSE